MVHELTRQDARRIAVRAQMLAASLRTDLLELVHQLTFIQIDLTAAVAPNVDLVCWSRLGPSYDAADLDTLLDDRSLVEFRGMLRPAADVALFRADMQDWPGREPLREWQIGNRAWVEANDACRRDIVQELRSEGPMPARAFPDSCAVPWRSSGWTNNRNVVRLLDFMEARGEVAVSSREGRERLWDLADRVSPTTRPYPPMRRSLCETGAGWPLGIARAKAPECPGEPQDVGEAGEPAVIDGVRGTWRVDPRQLGQPFQGRAALLSPLDRLVVDRKRIAEIFEFDYQLEMYKPAAKRRWGYYALPILCGDRLVGKLDATADQRAGVLRITAIHKDVEFSPTMRAEVDGEIRDLAQWLELEIEARADLVDPMRSLSRGLARLPAVRPAIGRARRDAGPVTDLNVLGAELEPCGMGPADRLLPRRLLQHRAGGPRREPHHLRRRHRGVPRAPARHRQRPVHPQTGVPLPGTGPGRPLVRDRGELGAAPTTTASRRRWCWPPPTSAVLEIVPLAALQRHAVDIPADPSSLAP